MSDFTRETTGSQVVDKYGKELAGKTIVITGPSEKSLGAEVANNFAQSKTPPKTILLLGRSLNKIQPVIDRVLSYNDSIEVDFVKLDLSDNSSVRTAASEIASKVDSIDILINSAGIMALEDYKLSKDGFELQLAACHIGHFLLTGLLLPQLEAARNGGRVVSLTSMGYEQGDFRFNDWNFSDGKTYERWTAYGQAKSANLMFINELARRGVSRKITAFAVHPGIVLESGIMKAVDMDGMNKAMDRSKEAAAARGEEYVPEETKSLKEGSSTTVVAALRPDLQSGTFLRDCQPVEKKDMRPWVVDEAQDGKLWKLSESWVGEKFL